MRKEVLRSLLYAGIVTVGLLVFVQSLGQWLSVDCPWWLNSVKRARTSRERLQRKAHSPRAVRPGARTCSGKRDPRLCEGHAQIPKTYSNRTHFNRKLLLTTLTLLNAMAAPAIIGFNKNPLKGYSSPAAMGIPIML